MTAGSGKERIHSTLFVSCSLYDRRSLEERIDLRFAEMKRQTHIHFVDLINAEDSSSEEEEEEEIEEEREGAAETGDWHHRATRPRAHLADRSGEAVGSAAEQRERRDGEKVMRLLANMTQNVMEAVSYFRHTGSMMERLLASNEAMVEEQVSASLVVVLVRGGVGNGGGVLRCLWWWWCVIVVPGGDGALLLLLVVMGHCCCYCW